MLLVILLILPLVGVAMIAPSYRSHELIPALNNNSSTSSEYADPDTKLKIIALAVSVITFLYSLSLLLLFDPTTAEYQFTYAFANKEASIFSSDFQIGIDGISLYFVVLTTFLSVSYTHLRAHET